MAANEKKRNTRAVSSGWVAISERPGAPGISVSFRVLKIEQAVGWVVRPRRWVLGTTERAPNEKNETRGLFLEIMQFH